MSARGCSIEAAAVDVDHQDTPTFWRDEDVPTIHNDRAVAFTGALFLSEAAENTHVIWKGVEYD
jgi:hypothetical protein